MCSLTQKSIIFLDVTHNRNLPCNLTLCVLRLNSSDKDGEPMYIQMVTALVLQLIQCVVHLPNDKDTFEECDKVGEQVNAQKPKHKQANISFIQMQTFRLPHKVFFSSSFFRWIKMC